MVLAIFTGCMAAPKQYLLHVKETGDPKHNCLNCAVDPVCRKENFPDAAADPRIAGRDTVPYLWWGSLAGPRAIAESRRRVLPVSPGPNRLIGPSDKKIISDAFVMCLLDNGYAWKDDR